MKTESQNPHGLLTVTVVCGVVLAYCSAMGLRQAGLETIPAYGFALLITAGASVAICRYRQTRQFAYVIVGLFAYIVAVSTDSVYIANQIHSNKPPIQEEAARVQAQGENVDLLRQELESLQTSPLVASIEARVTEKEKELKKELGSGDGPKAAQDRVELETLREELASARAHVVEQQDDLRGRLLDAQAKKSDATEEQSAAVADQHIALIWAAQMNPKAPEEALRAMVTVIAAVGELILLMLSWATSQRLVRAEEEAWLRPTLLEAEDLSQPRVPERARW